MAIVIDAKVNLRGATGPLAKLEASVNSIQAAVSQLNASLAATSGFAGAAASNLQKVARAASSNARVGARGSAAVGAGGARAATPRRTGAPPLAFANNPVQGMNYFAQAAASGNPYAIAQFARYSNLNSRMSRGQAAAQMHLQSGGSPLYSLFADVFKRTRFGKGGGGMPLGIDIMRLLNAGQGSYLNNLMGGIGSGGSGALAPALAGLAAGASAATAGLAAIAYVGFSAKSAMAGWQKQLTMGGGTFGQARAAQAISGAIGSDLASVGKNMNPLAAALAGVNPFGGPFGDNDYNKKGLAAFDYIRKIRSSGGSFSRARRYAELAGDENLANAYYLSPNVAKRLREERAGADSPESMTRNADFNGNLELFKRNWDDLMVGLASPFVKTAGQNLEAFGEIVKWIQDNLFRGWNDNVPNWLRELLIPGSGSTGSAQDKHTDAVKSNTDAIDGLTRRLTDGTFGGGPRASGAIPRGLSPAAMPGYQGVGYGVL